MHILIIASETGSTTTSKLTLVPVEPAPVEALLIATTGKCNCLASHKRVYNIDIVHFEVGAPGVNSGAGLIASRNCGILRMLDGDLVSSIGRGVSRIPVERQSALVSTDDDLLLVGAGVHENAGRR